MSELGWARFVSATSREVQDLQISQRQSWMLENTRLPGI